MRFFFSFIYPYTPHIDNNNWMDTWLIIRLVWTGRKNIKRKKTAKRTEIKEYNWIVEIYFVVKTLWQCSLWDKRIERKGVGAVRESGGLFPVWSSYVQKELKLKNLFCAQLPLFSPFPSNKKKKREWNPLLPPLLLLLPLLNHNWIIFR